MVGPQQYNPGQAKGNPGSIRQQRIRQDEQHRYHNLDARVEAVQTAFSFVKTIKGVSMHRESIPLDTLVYAKQLRQRVIYCSQAVSKLRKEGRDNYVPFPYTRVGEISLSYVAKPGR